MPFKKTHGMRNTRLYNIWINMKSRCHNKNNKFYNRYGGRGIIICDEWKNSFINFYNWSIENGYMKNLTIDRINNDGNYEPNNCKWSNMKEQCNNRSSNINITYNDITGNIEFWAKKTNIQRQTLEYRYKIGWNIEDIFNIIPNIGNNQSLRKKV